MKKKERSTTFNKIPWAFIGVFSLFFIVALLLLKSSTDNYQAITPSSAQVYFDGEYRIGDGEWKRITDGEHIPATKGDVTLRGGFHALAPDGQYLGMAKAGIPIAFFLDHINVQIIEGDREPYEMYNDNPELGPSLCGEMWMSYTPVFDDMNSFEILIRNPHKFGNETAVDSLLENFDFWTGAAFEGEVLSRGETQRYVGLLFCIGALVILGIALFSSFLHIPNLILVWLSGFSVFSVGCYLMYSSTGSYFFSELIAVNTTMVGASMMFYMLFISATVAAMGRKTKRISTIVTCILGVFDGAFILLPVVSNVYFYNTWGIFAIVQSLANAVLVGCLIFEMKDSSSDEKKERIPWRQIGVIALLTAFVVDAIATYFGWWKGGVVSTYAFAGFFVLVLVFVLAVIPQNILALTRAKESELERVRLEAEKNAIEAELKESRISTMLSQIQPHFIYNTLGTIERLCLKSPEKAFELVRNFSLYLRGNFSELDSVAPILFTQEIKHVQYYVNIEKVRFPDMTVEYRLDSTGFVLPALSVQPLVENAIKHGLMRLEVGGTVVIHSFETESHYCVEVTDNGVGFDTTVSINKKEHVGLHNIRERLKAIVNGTLLVESEVGAGTKATIMIPKEDAV